MSEGLDSEEGCNIFHGQSYDREYRKAHPEHANRNLFPLSDKYNADYDMVPFWINPAIVGLVLFGVGTAVELPIRDMSMHVRSRRKPASGG